MKQKRGGKFLFEGKFPLIRFGIFAEDSNQSDSGNHSNPTETDDVVILTSEPEIEDFVHEEGDGDLHEDVDFLKEIDFIGISGDLPSSIELNLDDDEFGPLPGFDNRCFKKVNEVVQPITKTGEDVNALKILFSSSKPMEVSSDSRLGVPSVSQAPPVLSTYTTTTVTTTTTTVSIPPLQSEEGSSTIFEAGGSSSIPEYSPTQPSLDEALI
ncbi:unnamed protein product [Lactuca saligna]|uniref:Uncharacterized protein n=1 Tax=Lactuca saligna TaxID=75948 RepID=A0AA35ZE88_LACSI|nr:unnamed protein product [Lactuca saligna]